ncbi:hypothetical protein BRN30_06365 [Xanthomonas oryzae pv. oryzae]|nr:hypothetical protein BRN30_06365 [Xanthomonas oryzae pv. oryzae]
MRIDAGCHPEKRSTPASNIEPKNSTARAISILRPRLTDCGVADVEEVMPAIFSCRRRQCPRRRRARHVSSIAVARTAAASPNHCTA